MEWPVWLYLAPSLLVVWIVALVVLYLYGCHLLDLKRAGRLWQDEVRWRLIGIALLLLSPLIFVFGCLAVLAYFLGHLDDEKWECGDGV